jgi:hypothetical protein
MVSSQERLLPPRKLPEEAESPQAGFLGNVFSIMVVAGKPACQIVGRIKVRHDNLLELHWWFSCAHGLHSIYIMTAEVEILFPTEFLAWKAAGK